MKSRILAALALVAALGTTTAWAQADSLIPKGGPKIPMSQMIADLKADAPYTRNGAAYELAHMGPKAAPAVPALIEALQDPAASVRYPVTIALREIGPAAKAAVPALTKVAEEDLNDEVSASALQALRKIDPAAAEKAAAGK
ncbi:MAG: HEAT repeat domain-containing protein [Deltaproteobacteria bacterium]